MHFLCFNLPLTIEVLELLGEEREEEKVYFSMYIFTCSFHIFTCNRKWPETFFHQFVGFFVYFFVVCLGFFWGEAGRFKCTFTVAVGKTKTISCLLLLFPFCVIPLTKARTWMVLLALAVQLILLHPAIRHYCPILLDQNSCVVE